MTDKGEKCMGLSFCLILHFELMEKSQKNKDFPGQSY